MELVHYSKNPIPEIYSVEQSPHPSMKPRGLWVSCEPGDPDWKSWCAAENFADLSQYVRIPIFLHPGANILLLNTVESILAFSAEYVADCMPSPWGSMRLDWQAVAEKYDGIIIAPYQWSLRFDLRAEWYYGWDCASGCIWSAQAIADAASEKKMLEGGTA